MSDSKSNLNTEPESPELIPQPEGPVRPARALPPLSPTAASPPRSPASPASPREIPGNLQQAIEEEEARRSRAERRERLANAETESEHEIEADELPDPAPVYYPTAEAAAAAAVAAAAAAAAGRETVVVSDDDEEDDSMLDSAPAPASAAAAAAAAPAPASESKSVGGGGGGGGGSSSSAAVAPKTDVKANAAAKPRGWTAAYKDVAKDDSKFDSNSSTDDDEETLYLCGQIEFNCLGSERDDIEDMLQDVATYMVLQRRDAEKNGAPGADRKTSFKLAADQYEYEQEELTRKPKQAIDALADWFGQHCAEHKIAWPPSSEKLHEIFTDVLLMELAPWPEEDKVSGHKHPADRQKGGAADEAELDRPAKRAKSSPPMQDTEDSDDADDEADGDDDGNDGDEVMRNSDQSL